MSEAVKKNRAVVASIGNLKPAEAQRNVWVLDAPEGTIEEDLKDTGFWSFISYRLRPFDRLEIRANDGSWLIDAIVIMCDRTWAKIKILNKYNLAPNEKSMQDEIAQAEEKSSKHSVKWRGPAHRWSVIRNSDETVVKENCESKADAEKWIREHEKAF